MMVPFVAPPSMGITILTIWMNTYDIIAVPRMEGPETETSSVDEIQKSPKQFHGIDKPNMITTAHIHDLLFQPIYIC